jgi:hypothetical protein
LTESSFSQLNSKNDRTNNKRIFRNQTFDESKNIHLPIAAKIGAARANQLSTALSAFLQLFKTEFAFLAVKITKKKKKKKKKKRKLTCDVMFSSTTSVAWRAPNLRTSFFAGTPRCPRHGRAANVGLPTVCRLLAKQERNSRQFFAISNRNKTEPFATQWR